MSKYLFEDYKRATKAVSNMLILIVAYRIANVRVWLERYRFDHEGDDQPDFISLALRDAYERGRRQLAAMEHEHLTLLAQDAALAANRSAITLANTPSELNQASLELIEMSKRIASLDSGTRQSLIIILGVPED